MAGMIINHIRTAGMYLLLIRNHVTVTY